MISWLTVWLSGLVTLFSLFCDLRFTPTVEKRKRIEELFARLRMEKTALVWMENEKWF